MCRWLMCVDNCKLTHWAYWLYYMQFPLENRENKNSRNVCLSQIREKYLLVKFSAYTVSYCLQDCNWQYTESMQQR